MRALDPRSWRIAVKVPLAVAALMLLVGVVVSQAVLSRLQDTQEANFRALAQSYLDGLSSSLTPSILRDDVWEVFDAIERAQAISQGTRPLRTIATNAEGVVVAASDPRRFPTGSKLRDVAEGFGFESGASEATASRKLEFPGRVVGFIHAVFDTRHLAAERREIMYALIITNGLLTVLLAAGGWILVSRMLRPVRILTEHLGSGDRLAARPIPPRLLTAGRGEFDRLFSSYNELVTSMSERELLVKRLADEERLASLGRLSSTLAHEINNPLGGLFNAMSTLKTHGHIASIRIGALGLLERGLLSIRDVVRTTLAVHRSDTEPRLLSSDDFSDIVLLVKLQARRKGVAVTLSNSFKGDLDVPATPIRQAALNLVLNAVAAAPEGSSVTLSITANEDVLTIAVRDSGDGLPADLAGILYEPIQRSPLHARSGLGLWTTRRLIGELGGQIAVDYPTTGGTEIRLLVPLRKEELPNVA